MWKLTLDSLKFKSLNGRIKVGERTKDLLKRVRSKDIVLLKHRDLDGVVAEELCDKKVKAIINASDTMSGDYIACGARICLESGIPIYEIDEADFKRFNEGEKLSIHGDYITYQQSIIPCRPFTMDECIRKQTVAEKKEIQKFKAFVQNTLRFAWKERHVFSERLSNWPIETQLQGRYVVVVVRGKGYKDDLTCLSSFIHGEKPILIGVDGGADAILEQGYHPDMIIGDMDSVSDSALRSGAEIIVHAYADGSAPGLKRIETLGLYAKKLPAPGTSEDVAIWLAYEQQARYIVTVGTHTHMIDFLEKGRKGMASTMLIRMKAGQRLLDAKGVSLLYQDDKKSNRWLWLPAAAFIPFAMMIWLHPTTHNMLTYFYVHLKMLVLSVTA